jgi:hypothetical protein
MPKGRGSNKRRAKYQKDKSESVGKGYLKMVALYERALKVQHKRRKAAKRALKRNTVSGSGG